jgi:hypothetical protein
MKTVLMVRVFMYCNECGLPIASGLVNPTLRKDNHKRSSWINCSRLVLIATASISLSGPAIAEWQLASPLPSSFMTRPNAAVVLVAGMGGGNTTGGMGAGTTAAGGFGTAGGSPSWNSPQPAYYTYQCVTPAGQCSFTAPAALRSSSLQAGARCACAAGQPEGRVR